VEDSSPYFSIVKNEKEGGRCGCTVHGKRGLTASCSKPIGRYVAKRCVEHPRGEESELTQCQEAAHEEIQ
jgi:hypothetical protein